MPRTGPSVPSEREPCRDGRFLRRITQNWFPLGLARTAQDRAAGLVEVQAVVDRRRTRDRHEAQAGGRVLAGPR